MRTKGFKRTMMGVVIGSVAGLMVINYNNKRLGHSETIKRH